jgi:hypothetical protein
LQSLADDPDDLLRELQQLAAAGGGGPSNATITVDGFQGSSALPPKSAISYIVINPDMFAAQYNFPPFDGGRVEVYTKQGQSSYHGARFLPPTEALGLMPAIPSRPAKPLSANNAMALSSLARSANPKATSPLPWSIAASITSRLLTRLPWTMPAIPSIPLPTLRRRSVFGSELAHLKRNKVAAAYNHAMYLKQRTVMMQWWSDYLEGQLALGRKSLAA